jgi:energy-coupling factor transport system ATP-binding protein
MIELTDLNHRILKIRACTLPEGHGAIIGRNGSGKTTLLELCAGLTRPESGTVAVGGRDPRSCEVGWVCEFPDRNMLFERVIDEISSPLLFRRIPAAEVEAAVREVADRVGITRLLTASVRRLSGGEKALVALATALVVSPEILVLDEVDSHLDHGTASRIRDLLRESSIPVILQSTQNMDAAAAADWVLFLKEGRILHLGSPADVFPAFEGTCFYPPLWRIAGCR